MLQKFSNAFKFYVLRDRKVEHFKRWFDDNGDETLRLDYPLDSDSVVFDLGGYRGDFAAQISSKYACTIHIFEPMPAFHAVCADRFKGSSKVFCYKFGLSSETGSFPISNAANGSSISAPGNAKSTLLADVRSIVDFMAESKIETVDLMKINIEGGEYDVLPALIESGLIRHFRNLQIQFHDFIPDAELKRDSIRRDLLQTHTESWCYPFVWESWALRAAN